MAFKSRSTLQLFGARKLLISALFTTSFPSIFGLVVIPLIIAPNQLDHLTVSRLDLFTRRFRFLPTQTKLLSLALAFHQATLLGRQL
jgi:hypothetical protein